MTGRCQNPGCERLATVTVRIYGLGDRDFCYFCEQALTSMGMGLRRLDPATVPAWRKRAAAKDYTGSVA